MRSYESCEVRRTRPRTSYPLASSNSARYEPSWPVMPVINAVLRGCPTAPAALALGAAPRRAGSCFLALISSVRQVHGARVRDLWQGPHDGAQHQPREQQDESPLVPQPAARACGRERYDAPAAGLHPLLEVESRHESGLTKRGTQGPPRARAVPRGTRHAPSNSIRSEEHTSELQSQSNLVCRLLLEKKNKKN